MRKLFLPSRLFTALKNIVCVAPSHIRLFSNLKNLPKPDANHDDGVLGAIAAALSWKNIVSTFISHDKTLNFISCAPLFFSVDVTLEIFFLIALCIVCTTYFNKTFNNIER